MKIRTILHPTDYSDHAECAFRLACSLARDHDARLVILHVAPAVTEEEYSPSPLLPSLSTSALAASAAGSARRPAGAR